MSLLRRSVAEGIATAFLLSIVVGSGIMGERLGNGNAAVVLLANALATGCGLLALITSFGPVSGAHMNPVVSIVLAAVGKFRWSDAPFYVAAQVIGAILGVWAAHAMFGMPIVEISTKVRSGSGQVLSETVATSGLLVIILSGLRHRPDTVPVTVACYITAAYWFTASTSFANPAVTLARALTESFAGIRPDDVAGFWLGQVLGTVAVLGAYAMFRQGPRRELADS